MAIDITQVNGGQSANGSASQKTGSTAKSAADARQSTASDNAPEATPAAATDTLTVTDQAVKLQQLEQELTNIPAVDATRVDKLRYDVETGAYKIDSKAIAEKLIGFEREFS